jgi:hypothetical protein
MRKQNNTDGRMERPEMHVNNKQLKENSTVDCSDQSSDAILTSVKKALVA